MTTKEVSTFEFLTNFSSWKTLLHVMTYVPCFPKYVKVKTAINRPFTVTEVNNTYNHICLLIERSEISGDIDLLYKERTCSNCIQQPSPFIDDAGITCVIGQLKNSAFT